MANLPDFKDRAGNHVKRVTTPYGRQFTTSGMKYHAMQQRINPDGLTQKTHHLYRGCFSTFSDFNEFSGWCQCQVGYCDEFQLDKDILLKGNKEYGKNLCVFLPPELNSLLTKRDKGRGEYPIGVSVDKNGIRARCSIAKGESYFIGYFCSVEDAFNAYKNFKESFIKQQAEKWKSQIDHRAYRALMSYEVLIAD